MVNKRSEARKESSGVPTLVLSLGRSPIQHGPLSVVRSLGRFGVPMYTVCDSGSPVMKSRFLEKAFAWSADEGSMEDTLGFLLDVGRQIGRRPVLIPTDDLGTILLDEHANVLKERFLFPQQPQGLGRSLSNKKEMYYLCKRMDVPTPEAAFPMSREDVVDYVRDAAFPVVMKGIDAWSHYGTLRETGMDRVLILKSTSELLESYGKLEAAGSPDVLLQEYIPGGPESVWMFNGYFDEGSNCLLGYTGQKIRQHPPYTGFTTLGQCVDNETVENVTKRFMKELGYRGTLDIGYRYDARDGKYKLLDVNPRMGGTFRLFVGENGMDVARALYLDLTGQKVDDSPVRPGRRWVVENYDLFSSIAYARDGRLKFGSWVRSLRDVQEGAWFAADDLAPTRLVLFSSIGKFFVLLAKGPLLRWLSASQRWLSSRGRI